LKKVTGICIKEFNKKRNTYGWRALSIQERPNVPEPVKPEEKPQVQEEIKQSVAEQSPYPAEPAPEPGNPVVVPDISPVSAILPVNEIATSIENSEAPGTSVSEIQPEGNPAAE
jgi:hypothetical protein